VVLPPTAIGKDFPYEGRWIGITPSRTGAFATLAGYVGLTVAWIEGFELNFFGAVLGLDVRRPALKLPGLGRFGVASYSGAVGSCLIECLRRGVHYVLREG